MSAYAAKQHLNQTIRNDRFRWGVMVGLSLSDQVGTNTFNGHVRDRRSYSAQPGQ